MSSDKASVVKQPCEEDWHKSEREGWIFCVLFKHSIITRGYWYFKSILLFTCSNKLDYSLAKVLKSRNLKVLTLCSVGHPDVCFLTCAKAELPFLFTSLDTLCATRGSWSLPDARSLGAELKSSSASSWLKWHSPYVLDLMNVFFGGVFFTDALSLSVYSAITVSSSPSISSSFPEKSDSCPSLWQSGCARLRTLRKTEWILRGLNGRLSFWGEATSVPVLVTFTSLTQAGATLFPRLVPEPMSVCLGC